MTTQKPHLWGLRKPDLQAALIEMNIPEKKARYHSRQIFQWIYQRKVYDPSQMTDLSKVVREALIEKFSHKPPVDQCFDSESTDGTRKFLFKLHDSKTVESVLIPAENDQGVERMTICISSQVGCAMACKFCNTGDQGLIRNLEVQEIVGQVLELSKKAELTNIVFMGMGEPLHNLENVCRAIEILVNQDALNFSKRKITVSTSGLVPAIRKMNERLQGDARVNLAISLNSSHDEQRTAVMPVNKPYPIAELMKACREFELGPHRWITYEYVMMGGYNDKTEDAQRVYDLLKDQKGKAKVNLIPYNPHPASLYKRPSLHTVERFQRYLLDRGMTTTIRISKGKDILSCLWPASICEKRATGSESIVNYMEIERFTLLSK